AETAHHLGFLFLRAAASVFGGAMRRFFAPADAILAVDALGLRFASPIGLAAGFDKDGIGVRALFSLGFASVEVGTVTNEPQPGNPRPRMFRLVADRALVNRMGFNNGGADAAASRLARARPVPGVLGVNIGKTKRVDEAGAIDDYVASTEKLARRADY